MAAVGRVAAMVTLLVLSSKSQAQLSSSFYEKTCPSALSTIRTVVRASIERERRMAASLIRLHFHDCFVQGCDASILLDDSPSIKSEKFARQSNNSLRGYKVIDKAKSAVEKTCPGVVSCADIVAVAARDASKYVGGPSWNVKLGRRDSTTANITLATSQLPGVNNSLEELISLFGSKGLSAREMVALSGSHTCCNQTKSSSVVDVLITLCWSIAGTDLLLIPISPLP
ncbi:Peroxidase 4 [Hibiscus syriacus]|uniref:peroxidase n=1 Tax=Hibiscus syriacus TaxID=106335 RepID=A0A6A3BS24_HIBSY|nr:Peroxidase 4 [Hibiscus syriacus]